MELTHLPKRIKDMRGYPNKIVIPRLITNSDNMWLAMNFIY